MIYYGAQWMKTLLLTISSFVSTSLLHCFSLLSPFLYSNPFRNIEMHREISDCHFNRFFAEIQLKKENSKSAFGRQSLGDQTGTLVSQTAWICHWYISGSLNFWRKIIIEEKEPDKRTTKWVMLSRSIRKTKWSMLKVKATSMMTMTTTRKFNFKFFYRRFL